MGCMLIGHTSAISKGDVSIAIGLGKGASMSHSI